MIKLLITILCIIGCVSCTTPVATKPTLISTKPPIVVQQALEKSQSKPATTLVDGKYIVTSTQRGKMSWYSVKTNFGTATASGQKFSNHKATAAHKKLKMGTMVRITNLSNGRSRILRINDRGPYKPGRIVDVAVGMSYSAHLNFYTKGVVPCKLEVLKRVK